jgi:hypothetical protein
LHHLDSNEFTTLTQQVTETFTKRMRQQPTTMITASNLHHVLVALAPAVNTFGRPPPRQCAFHIVPPYYFDPLLLDAQDWEVLRSDAVIAHPEVTLRAGKEFKILGEILLAQPAFKVSSKVMKSKSKDPKAKEDSWGSP